MAKKSWFERNKRKQATVTKYAAKRAELKAKRDYAGLAKLLHEPMHIVCDQAQVHKTARAVGGRLGAAGENLDEAVAGNVQVDQHEPAIGVVEAKGFMNAKLGVESQRAVEVVGRKGKVADIGDHAWSPNG